MGEEKREYFRLNRRIEVRWRKEPDAQEGVEAASNIGSTQDISAGGLCLVAAQRIRLGDILQLNIDIGWKTIRARGLVIRMRGSEAGVQFIHLGRDAQRDMNRFIFEEHKNG